jgi:hypothetical protein
MSNMQFVQNIVFAFYMGEPMQPVGEECPGKKYD